MLLLRLLLVVLLSLSLGAERLKLPHSSIGLDSAEGQELLQTSQAKSNYWALSQHFVTQDEPSHCGPASAVMVLNSLGLAAPLSQVHRPFHYFDQSNFYSSAQEAVLPLRLLRQQGATLQQLGGLIKTWGVEVKVNHASAGGLEAFRDQASQALASDQTFVIINYHRDPLEQVGGSHFSPLAAYDSGSDRFLLLDVARYRYPPCWIKAERLFQAMNTVDSVSKQTRGYLLIGAAPLES